MSDVPSTPDEPPVPSDPTGAPTPPTPSTPPPAPPPPVVTYGQVPPTLNEIYYKPWPNILLTVLTCGIWRGIWSYRAHGDLQRYKGDGLGEVAGLLLGLFIYPVVMFTVPNEIEQMYQRDGRQSPESALLGLWFLLPIIGDLIWYFKVQRALNEFWISKGSQSAA